MIEMTIGRYFNSIQCSQNSIWYCVYDFVISYVLCINLNVFICFMHKFEYARVCECRCVFRRWKWIIWCDRFLLIICLTCHTWHMWVYICWPKYVYVVTGLLILFLYATIASFCSSAIGGACSVGSGNQEYS